MTDQPDDLTRNDEHPNDEVIVHRSPIDEAARRERLASKGYDEEEIIRDANFSHGFSPQQDISETPAPQRYADEY